MLKTKFNQANNATSKRVLLTAHQKTMHLLALVIFSATVGAGLGVGMPIITQTLLDKYIPQKDVTMIIWMMVTLVVLLLAKLLSTFILSYFGRILQNNVEWNIRKASFSHMERLSVEYIDMKNEGHFIVRINEDSNNISQFIRYLPENIISGLILSVSSFVVVFTYDLILGFILISIFLFLITFTYLLRSKFRASWDRIRQENERVSSTLVNSISGLKESKIFLAEQKEEKKYHKFLGHLQDAWRKNFGLYARWSTFNALVMGSVSLIILGIGSWRVIEYDMSIGKLVATVMFSGQIMEPINKFLAAFDIIVTAQTSLKRVGEFWQAPVEDYNSGQKFESKVKGGIEFRNVSFEYNVLNGNGFNEHEDWMQYRKKSQQQDKVKSDTVKKGVLKNVSFKIEPGQKVAFVGETGSGKSTILKLILRFYHETQGQVLVDDKDLNEMNIRSIREQISYLQQDPYLFYDSIRNNIILALKDGDTLTEAEQTKKILDALEIASASKFVSELPNGIEQNIGPRGIVLSGGQKQRIAISRAILKDAPIILLDEATSALDNETEKYIQDSLQKFTKDKTIIYIAHRLSTIKNLDKIFVLSKGQIVEEGTHEALMKRKGYYYKLNKMVE